MRQHLSLAARLIVIALACAAGATAASARGTFAAPAALLTGEYWSSLTPGERQAYLSGFVAGAAAEQARGEAVAAGRGNDSAAVSGSTSRAVVALRERRSLHFPFAPAVYSAQVDDFYWWTDHRTTPIVDAVVHFNGQMLKQQQGAQP